MFNIEGKVAIVTGGVGGIGKSYVRALLSKKAKGVVLLDINESAAKEFVSTLDSEFGPNKSLFINVDVTDLRKVEDAFKKTIEHFGNMDIIVNNAGVCIQNNIDLIVKLNLLATVQISNLALFTYFPKHKTGKEAVIINTSSVAGLYPFEMVPIYSATKHGVVAYTQAMGTETHYDYTHTKIMAICPGHTDTNIWHGMVDYYKQMMDENLQHLGTQTTDILGETLITVLEKGENGSVWISKDNEPAFEFDYKTKTLPIVIRAISAFSSP